MPISSAAIPEDQARAARDFLNSLTDEHKTPGLQYVFAGADEVLFRFNGGYADIDGKIPVRDDTTFNGYSVTKTFTAAAVVKLAIEGKIDLDQPIASYLDDFPYAKSPTVRQTLQHRGGFPAPNPMAWIHRAEQHDTFDKQAFIHEITHEHDKLIFEPGEKFTYSNIGYLLLGEVVRKASGMPYDQYVLAEIIEPLSVAGDQRIAFVIDEPQKHAHGYIRKWNWLTPLLGWFIDRRTFLQKSSGGWVQFQNFLVNGDPYGGLIGTAAGFARYLQAALRVEKPFTREMLDVMWEVGPTRSGETRRMHLGWASGVLDGERYFAHTGGGGGYYCEMRVYPDLQVASVIMTNNTGISNQHYLDRVDKYFLEAGN